MDGSKEEGRYHYADKLVDVAKYYGFDGWLFNIETKLPNADCVDKMVSFLQYLTRRTHEVCGEDSKVIWYDSVTCKGELRWQSALNAENRLFFDCCDGIFTDYKWKAGTPRECKEEAQRGRERGGGCRNFDVFTGIDVWGRGTFGGGGFNCAKALRVINEAQLSAALFAPAWTFEGRKGGAKGAEMVERHFWVGNDWYSIEIDVGAEFPKLHLPANPEIVTVEEGSGECVVDLEWVVYDGGSGGWKVLEEGSGPEVIHKGQRSVVSSFKWCTRKQEFDLLMLACRVRGEGGSEGGEGVTDVDTNMVFLSREELGRSPVISVGEWYVGTPPKVEDQFYLKV